MANLSLAWTGDYNSLKSLVRDELKLDGIWEQPGGYKKVFTSSDFTSISWSKEKKILTIVGKDSEQLKQKLFSMLIGDDTASTSEQVGVNTRETITARRHMHPDALIIVLILRVCTRVK